ncbi:hypothetical protein [Roseibium aggregatum]|uniref:Head-tail joining protein n=1 Tax=Roseibium aggregatum TaxID=187304 RepID=A0A0M6Y915_9HYPH|nr:hypothetical protein [Roseibium aggregatum]CTQ45767.1 hypothetical protein LAL4801_04222 [Roseibium aggregatum]
MGLSRDRVRQVVERAFASGGDLIRPGILRLPTTEYDRSTGKTVKTYVEHKCRVLPDGLASKGGVNKQEELGVLPGDRKMFVAELAVEPETKSVLEVDGRAFKVILASDVSAGSGALFELYVRG